MLTFTCPAACSNCGTPSSPHNRTSISRERILSLIQEAKQLGFSNVVFTGGEVTLRWDDLRRAIAEGVALARVGPTRRRVHASVDGTAARSATLAWVQGQLA
jgi:MoaA/NifB/PqqE/SkfB family radical SAM enzyme